MVDKTGTLTHGQARLRAAAALPPSGEAEALRLAASLDPASAHPIARTLVEEGKSRASSLASPSAVTEVPGDGVIGLVDGWRVSAGGPRLMRLQGIAFPSAGADADGQLASAAVPGGGRRPAAILSFADPLHRDCAAVVVALRESGIARVVLATGDRRKVAETFTAGLPIDAIAADLDPVDKTKVVLEERPRGPVMMVGEGINDARAVAGADLGVALWAGGAAGGAAADVVLLVDSLAPLPEALRIAKASAPSRSRACSSGSRSRSPGWSRRPSARTRRCRGAAAGGDRRSGDPERHAGPLGTRSRTPPLIAGDLMPLPGRATSALPAGLGDGADGAILRHSTKCQPDL